jgi:hypothetical protein
VTRRLRIAGRGGAEHFEAGFAKTARLALEQALADGAMVLCVVYETPTGVKHIPVPNAHAVAVGLHDQQRHALYPDSEKDQPHEA